MSSNAGGNRKKLHNVNRKGEARRNGVIMGLDVKLILYSGIFKPFLSYLITFLNSQFLKTCN